MLASQRWLVNLVWLLHIGIVSSFAFFNSPEHALAWRLVYGPSAEDCNLYRGAVHLLLECEQEDGEP